jgi:transglutaminase-like putative cysteine protease
MLSRSRIPAAAALATLLSVRGFGAGQSLDPQRTFEFTYEMTLKDLPPGRHSVEVWIPLASADSAQSVAVESLSSPVKTTETREAEYGNRILHADLSGQEGSTARLAVTYRVTRRTYSGERVDGADSAARFLAADRLVPIDGRMKELADRITAGKRDRREIARAIYDYVFQSLRYDKSGTGWGRGDAVWACDAKRGNCTDFHSLFIALMRAEKIPARFEIGFPLPESTREGEIPGYHCWAEFLVEGAGWVPVDISEAWKAPAKRDFFFGHLDANRIQFSIGRDLILAPRQQGDALNYFVYPYAEVDGQAYSAIDKRFSFKEIAPAGSGSGMP